MNYIKILKELKEINQNEAEHRFGADRLLRFLGNFICPFFIIFGISANLMCCIGLLLAVSAAVIIITGFDNSLVLATGIYLFVIILDYTDGSVARYTSSSNFFGRFLDGVCDNITGAIFHIAIFLYVNKQFELNPFIEILCIFSIPMWVLSSLIMDRYSTMVRWIKETHDVSILPTIKGEMPRFCFNYLFDCRILSVVSILFFPVCAIVFLLLSLFISTFVIIFHVKVASVKLNYSAESSREHFS